jgi:hypothetical protein
LKGVEGLNAKEFIAIEGSTTNSKNEVEPQDMKLKEKEKEDTRVSKKKEKQPAKKQDQAKK